MRELCFKLFAMSHFDTGIKVTAFSVSHFVYMFLIFGSIFLIWWRMRHKSAERKDKTLRVLAYALVVSYLSDFFFHDFVYGGMNIDKLPFHCCTVLCPLAAIAQFNRKGDHILEPTAVLAILSPLMYICYPASIGEGEPWCYQAVQTMFFHGVLLAWGVLNLALGKVQLSWKCFWKCAVMLVCITLWAKLGNVLLGHNWFFLNEDALYIGLVSGGIIPRWSLMIINPIVFLLASAIVYVIACPLQKRAQQKTAM